MAASLEDLSRVMVAAQPTGGRGLALDPSGKVPVSVLPQQVAGAVSSAGASLGGSGFTVVRASAGRYTITFTPEFTAAPAVLVTVVATTGNEQVSINATSSTTVQVNFNDPGTPGPSDRQFYFLAVQIR